jgi:hypothetical protein
MFQTKDVEKTKTHISSSVIFSPPPENHNFHECGGKKKCIVNFSTAVVFTRTRHSVTFYVHYIFYYFLGSEIFLSALVSPYKSAGCPFHLVPEHAYLSCRKLASVDTSRKSYRA